MQSSTTASCYKHNRPFQLIGNDTKCQLSCQICCDCLRGVDHGHKKDIVNHETIGTEQLIQHFQQIQKYNHQSLMECGEAIDRYFRTLQSMMRDELHRERDRMTKFARKIMLTDITKDPKKLSTITSLYLKEFTGIKCRQVGEISKELFGYQPKNISIGYRKFIEYLAERQAKVSEDFKEIISGKPYEKVVLKNCQEELLFPHFQNELQISRVKSQEKQSPKKTIRRSVKKVGSINDLKQFNIQLKKPIDFSGSKLITSKEDTQFILKCFDHRHPGAVKLLYRATQNNFSVKAFHQICDNQIDTLVIIQTQFGKIIGGYTPIPWKSTANTLHADVKHESFLFSLSLKQKMSLLDEKSATFNSINFGPTFGAGADLAICHNGNTEKTSYSQFPYSYANPRYKQNNQHSTTLFTGQKNGNHFLLKQWEVWKVKFDE